MFRIVTHLNQLKLKFFPHSLHHNFMTHLDKLQIIHHTYSHINAPSFLSSVAQLLKAGFSLYFYKDCFSLDLRDTASCSFGCKSVWKSFFSHQLKTARQTPQTLIPSCPSDPTNYRIPSWKFYCDRLRCNQNHWLKDFDGRVFSCRLVNAAVLLHFSFFC